MYKFKHRFFKDNIKFRYESHSLNKKKKERYSKED